MKVAIVKYNAGNVQSVKYALNRVGIEPIWTDDPQLLANADKVIFPGVGEASSAMQYLKARGLDTVIKQMKQPFLGICLGMQLMCTHSEEGNTDCLDIFKVRVKKFQSETFKIPHMGWNPVVDTKEPLFDQQLDNQDMYFVHSYFVERNDHSVATTHYSIPFSAAIHKDNFYAVQFHPEKSGLAGQQLLENFLKIKS